ncbi:hypothetical protein ABZ848_07080 [Streptomyces sp. NPDC047081]|uniref:hypothetical protein n=1 Tax=Streptomyces sp. NPDC047081 TaxID=3154706 RepID=UPI0033C324EB
MRSQNSEEDGTVGVREVWPEILESVKNRRRFAWLLLSQNVQSVGYSKKKIRLNFQNAGSRDTYLSADIETVLKETLVEDFGISCEIEVTAEMPTGDTRLEIKGRPTRAQIEEMTVGGEVIHEQFGKGAIISMAGAWPSTEAIIDFDSVGKKRLMLRYAPIAGV